MSILVRLQFSFLFANPRIDAEEAQHTPTTPVFPSTRRLILTTLFLHGRA